MAGTGIIFDMDGTLWDSSQEVADSWTEVLLAHPEAGRIVSREDIQSVMGMTMTRIAQTLFAGMEQERQMALLDACTAFENEYLAMHGAQLYSGLEETLQSLSAEYPLFIVSNCQSGYIEAFLEHYRFGRYFTDRLCFGDNGFPKADNIREIVSRNRLETGYYVGDIQADYDAAKEAGVRFIHASYGFGRIREAVPVIRSLTELPALMRELTERQPS